MNFKSYEYILKDPDVAAFQISTKQYESLRLVFEKFTPELIKRWNKIEDIKGLRHLLMRFNESFDEEADLYVELLLGNFSLNGLKIVISINFDDDNEQTVSDADALLFELKLVGE